MRYVRLFMSKSMSAHETVVQFPTSRAAACDERDVKQLDAMTPELQATLRRGAALREEIDELLRRQDRRAQEFECRLLSGLELIARLLSSQSQAAMTPEAGAQLSAAARRITAIGRSQDRPNIYDR
jgi:two-component system, sensor histidine kinase PdtaS